jgi:hypothetical protein
LGTEVKVENVQERKVAQDDSSAESFSEEDLNKGMMVCVTDEESNSNEVLMNFQGEEFFFSSEIAVFLL